MSSLWDLTLTLFLSLLLIPTLITILIVIRTFISKRSHSHRNALILCLGDVGRSPRMQYHAVSIAQTMQVYLVGYTGATCHTAVLTNPSIHLYLMSPIPFTFPRTLFPIYAMIKVMYQCIQLLWYMLIKCPPCHVILVQNPPSIPTLILARLVSILTRARFIIDWHNFGYTILGLARGINHPFVRVARIYEKYLGQQAHAHLCVTHAMNKWLASNWGVNATVLYDRAPSSFRQLNVEEKHELLSRLHADGTLKGVDGWIPQHGKYTKDKTICTEFDGKVHRLRSDRPAIIISSTSWTEDEDFSVLLDAIVTYDQHARNTSLLPHLLVIITGRGPLLSYYQNKMSKLTLQHTRIITVWLAASDYPKLLGCADVGVSLHTSSSGLDLPMKVVDMFGCGLPVCAIAFSCLDELVEDGKNGLIFTESAQLAQQLETLLRTFPSSTPTLDDMRKELRTFQSIRWTESWNQHAAPIVNAS